MRNDAALQYHLRAQSQISPIFNSHSALTLKLVYHYHLGPILSLFTMVCIVYHSRETEDVKIQVASCLMCRIDELAIPMLPRSPSHMSY